MEAPSGSPFVCLVFSVRGSVTPFAPSLISIARPKTPFVRSETPIAPIYISERRSENLFARSGVPFCRPGVAVLAGVEAFAGQVFQHVSMAALIFNGLERGTRLASPSSIAGVCCSSGLFSFEWCASCLADS
jgi:hypothetical protein